jgi:hypothetical protein
MLEPRGGVLYDASRRDTEASLTATGGLPVTNLSADSRVSNSRPSGEAARPVGVDSIGDLSAVRPRGINSARHCRPGMVKLEYGERPPWDFDHWDVGLLSALTEG